MKELEAIIEKWRKLGDNLESANRVLEQQWPRQCADELEALLPALEKAFIDLESEVSRYRGNYRGAQAEIAALRARCEQNDVQLAGCATAAQGWAKEPPQPGDYGWSASFQEVLNLRQKWESACKLMICGHPRACWNDGSLPAGLTGGNDWIRPYCTACEHKRLAAAAAIDKTEELFVKILRGELPAMSANNCDAVAQALDAHDADTRNRALEKAAIEVATHLFYTGPGGFDPERIQETLALRIRALKREKRGEE